MCVGVFIIMFKKEMSELAYKNATIAYKKDEVPVGAVICVGDKIIAQSFNKKESNNDITAHAEIEVIRKAQKKLKTYILSNCEMYVTLEPCLMCFSALQQCRIKKVYFGAKNVKFGAILSNFNLIDNKNFNYMFEYEFYNDERCSILLKDFFQKKR